MENYSKWDDEEIKTLFRFVEIKKQEGVPLIKIFANYATKTFRQANSVRNYYYKELAHMQECTTRANELGINLKNHIVVQGQAFSKQEEQEVLSQINKLKEKGYSIRKACLELSNGDVSKMIRLQNKYRALTKQKQPKQSNVVNMGQVIKMQPKQPKISDEEIKALFFGLIKIVKKQEQENIKSQYESEIFTANEKLKNVMFEIVEKQKIIDALQSKLSLIKNELQKQESTSKKEIKMSASSMLKKYFKEQSYSLIKDSVNKE